MSDETPLPSEQGKQTYQRILGEAFDKPLVGIRELTLDHLFAQIWNREGLSDRERSMVTIALLAFQGHRDQLMAHVRGAKRRGMSRDDVLELMIHVAHYGGWGAGASGQAAAMKVYDEP